MSRVVYRVRDTVTGLWKIRQNFGDVNSRAVDFATAEQARTAARYLKRWRIVKVTVYPKPKDWEGLLAWMSGESEKFAPLNRELIDAERAVLEAAEKWASWQPRQSIETLTELSAARPDSESYGLRLAVARMLKARGEKT